MTLNVNLIESGKCGNKKLIIYRETVLQKILSGCPLNEFQELCSKAYRIRDKGDSLFWICFTVPKLFALKSHARTYMCMEAQAHCLQNT